MGTRRSFREILLAAIAVSLLLGCQSIEVSADFRRNFRFTSVETYAWLPDPPGHAGDPVLHNDLIDGRVRDAIDRELQAMGYRQVTVEEADLHVTYYLGLETRVSMRMVTNAYQYQGGFFDHHSSQTTLREYERGTLLIDMLEAPRRRLIWRGTANARVRRRSDPEEREQKINDAVEQTLAQFPPGGPQSRPGRRIRNGAAPPTDSKLRPGTRCVVFQTPSRCRSVVQFREAPHGPHRHPLPLG